MHTGRLSVSTKIILKVQFTVNYLHISIDVTHSLQENIAYYPNCNSLH